MISLTPLEFTDDWVTALRVHPSIRQGSLHRPAGSDFFLFPRSCYTDIPNFTIGRAGWDNWMIYKARKEKWAVIDCTPSVMIVHQNHDYSHLPGGKPHYDPPERTKISVSPAGRPTSATPSWIQPTDSLVVNLSARRCPPCASSAAWSCSCGRFSSSCLKT